MSRKFVGVCLFWIGSPPSLLGGILIASPGARGFAPQMLAVGIALLVVGIVLIVRARRAKEPLFPTARGFRHAMRGIWIVIGVAGVLEVLLGVLFLVSGEVSGWVLVAMGLFGSLAFFSEWDRSPRRSRRWPKPELAQNEIVIWGSLARHSSARFSPDGGLTLTDRRLAFVLASTERGFGLVDAEWSLDRIASASIATTDWDGTPYSPQPVLLVEMTDGTIERFAGPDGEVAMTAIEEQLGRR